MFFVRRDFVALVIIHSAQVVCLSGISVVGILACRASCFVRLLATMSRTFRDKGFSWIMVVGHFADGAMTVGSLTLTLLKRS